MKCRTILIAATPEPLPIYAVDRTAHLHRVKPMTSRTRAQFERAFRRVLQGAGVIKPDPLPRRWPCIWDVKQSTLAELHEQRPLAPRSWSVFPFKRNERYPMFMDGRRADMTR